MFHYPLSQKSIFIALIIGVGSFFNENFYIFLFWNIILSIKIFRDYIGYGMSRRVLLDVLSVFHLILIFYIFPLLFFAPVFVMGDRSGSWFLMNLALAFMPLIFTTFWFVTGAASLALAALNVGNILVAGQDRQPLDLIKPSTIAPFAVALVGFAFHFLPDAVLQVTLPNGRSLWAAF